MTRPQRFARNRSCPAALYKKRSRSVLKLFGKQFHLGNGGISLVRCFALYAGAFLLPQLSLAQAPDLLATPPGPAEEYAVSAGGVDMRTGQFTYSTTELDSFGPGGIHFTRNNGSNDFHIWQPMGQFSHNWHIYLTYKPIKGGQANFSVGGARGKQFITSNNNNFTAKSSDYLTSLQAFPTGSGATDRYMVYTGTDGEKITFRPQTTPTDGANRGQVMGGASFYAAKIERPNGVTYTLSYDEPTSTTPAFLRRVTSSTGYVLILEWVTTPVEKFISKACLFNGAVDTVPVSNSCGSADRTAIYTYGTNGYMISAVNPAGNTRTYSSTFNSAWHNSPGNYTWFERLYHPGESAPYLTNTMHRNLLVEYVQSQNFADGADYSYTWNIVEHNEWTMEVAGGVATRSDGAKTTVGYQVMRRPYESYPDSYMISEGPNRIVDELGRSLTSDYCTGGPGGGGCAITWLKYWKYPEGNQTIYAYNGWGRLISATDKAKPGTSDPDITQSFAYNCASSLTCVHPTSITDGRGNTTNAVYSATHGGILKRTLPADANGVRPETRYTYAQRYAWKKSGGSYVASTPPVWVLLSEEYCRTSSANSAGSCAAGAADEVVTSYEYEAGSSTKGSNLLLLGTAVTADGQTLRTCFTYDKWGRRISETQPKAGLASCQ